MLTPDGKHIVFGDAFGITRVTLKTMALKHSLKVAAPRRDVSIHSTGKLAVTDGYDQSGAYGNDAVMLLGLPGVGVKAKLGSPTGPIAFWGDRLVQLVSGSLRVQVIDGKSRSDEREISLDGGKLLPSTTVGPLSEGDPQQFTDRLCVNPNGAFAALTGYCLVVGHLNGDADVAVTFRLPLVIFDGVEIGLSRTEDRTFVIATDWAHHKARILPVEDDGSFGPILEVDAIGLPTVSGQSLLYQPSNEAVVRRSLENGNEERFDVTATLAHPAEAPEEEFWGKTPRPVPTQLPGTLLDGGEKLFFVPWHMETVCELTQGVTLDRNLVPGAGPFRRGALEIMAHNNDRLAPLQMRQSFAHFENNEKRGSCPIGLQMSCSPPSLTRAVASDYMGDWTERHSLVTHRWSWGSIARTGGVHRHELSQYGVDDTEAMLAWMHTAGIRVVDTSSFFEPMYQSVLGMPSDPRPQDMLFIDGAERLFVHAVLDSMASGAPSDTSKFAAWKKASVTAQQAVDAIERFAGEKHRGARMLAAMLVHHLDAEAFAPVVALVNAKNKFHQAESDAGELLVTLAYAHPDLKDRIIESIADVEEFTRGKLMDAIGRGARHLWQS